MLQITINPDTGTASLAALRADPRSPAVVRAALLRPSAVTIRRWLELEDAASPWATGRWPGDPADAMRACAQAWAILWPGSHPPQPEEAARLISSQISQAFCTALECRWPARAGDTRARAPHDATGWLARLLARLCAALSLTPDQALDIPLDQAFLLAAGWNLNDGMEPLGEDYHTRAPTAPAPAAAPAGCTASAAPPQAAPPARSP